MAHDTENQVATQVDSSATESPASEVAGAHPRRTGFALMDPERRKAIASAGGKAAHARGTAHRFDSHAASEAGRRAHQRGTAHVWTPEAAREAGRKGGRAARKRSQAGLANTNVLGDSPQPGPAFELRSVEPRETLPDAS